MEKLRSLHHNPNLVLLINVIIPLSLLIGGLVLLFAKIPGWGVILGLPMIVIGVIFLIYTYDEVSRIRSEDDYD